MRWCRNSSRQTKNAAAARITAAIPHLIGRCFLLCLIPGRAMSMPRQRAFGVPEKMRKESHCNQKLGFLEHLLGVSASDSNCSIPNKSTRKTILGPRPGHRMQGMRIWSPQRRNLLILGGARRPARHIRQADLVVCGHTHMQFDRMIGTTRAVNASSVGVPFGPFGAATSVAAQP